MTFVDEMLFLSLFELLLYCHYDYDNGVLPFTYNLCIMLVSSDFQNYVSTHSFRDAFLYNNRLWFGGCISDEEYDANRNYILAKRNVH